MMKKTILFYLLLLSFCLNAHANEKTLYTKNHSPKQSEQSLDQIVALINDDVITQSEYREALAKAKTQITQEEVTPLPEKILHKQILDQLINRKLQLQIAKQIGIQTTTKEVEEAIKHIADQNHISLNSLYQHVNQEGMSTSEYKQEIHDQIIMQKLQQQEVITKITVSPDEITRFLNSKTWQNNDAKEYHLEDLLAPLPEKPSAAEIAHAKTRAQTALAELNGGKTFADLIQAEIGQSDGLQGGDLGWRKLPEIPGIFAQRILQMKPNQYAGPIQAPNGFHIIRLVASRKLTTKPTTPTKSQVENMLMQHKFEEAVQSWISRLRGQAFIQIEKEYLPS